MLVAWRLVRPEAARVLSPAPEPAALLMSVLVLVLAPTAALALMRKTPLLRVPVLVRRTVMRRAEQRQNPAGEHHSQEGWFSRGGTVQGADLRVTFAVVVCNL